MKKVTCAACLWNDKCGTGRLKEPCPYYTPMDMERLVQAEYEQGLFERGKAYDSIVKEQQS